MGYGRIIAGLILLFNPVVHVVDVLPDAIGYFLIASGLTQMAYYIGEISKAREIFLKLALIECTKLPALLLVPYSSGSMKVLLALVFGLAEAFLVIPAFGEFFEGLSFAGIRYNGNAVYTGAPKKEKKSKKRKAEKAAPENRDYITKIRNYIIFFLIFRAGATLVPELTELQLYDHTGEVKQLQFSLAHYKPFIYVVCAVAVSVLGIIYIVRVVRYFGAVKNDKPFNDALDKKYRGDILPNENLFTAKRMRAVLVLLAASAVLELTVVFDEISVIPGVIPAILIAVSACLVSKYVKIAVYALPLAALRAVVSVFAYTAQLKYFGEYELEAVRWLDEASDLYERMSFFSALEKVLAMLTFVYCLFMIMKAVKVNLAGFGIQNASAQYSKRNHDLETTNYVGSKLLMCAVIAVINFIFSASYHYMAKSTEAALLIVTVINIVFVSYSIYTASVINTSVYSNNSEM